MMASKPLVEDVVAAAVSAGIQTSQEAVAFALGFATAMSAPAMDTAPFKIYYHDGFSGRAQSLFLLFADAGLEYERKSKGDVTDPTVFAVPAVESGGEWRSQTVASLRFVAGRLGYEVSLELDNIALKISLDVGDIWAEVFEQSKSHGGAGISDEWIGTRLTKWLKCLNASLLRTKSSDGHFCVGSAISFVDFLVLNLALVLEFTLGADKAQSLLSAVAPVVATASTATRERPGVSAYLSDCGEPVLFPLCQAPE